MDAFTTAFGFFILVALASIPLGGLIVYWLIQARQGQTWPTESTADNDVLPVLPGFGLYRFRKTVYFHAAGHHPGDAGIEMKRHLQQIEVSDRANHY